MRVGLENDSRTISSGLKQLVRQSRRLVLDPFSGLFRGGRPLTALGRTAPVDTYSTGSTPAGVYQMVGNVWEWISSEFRADVEGVEVEAEPLFMSIRGASFATYFDSQAGCQVQSADCPFARKWNIGLRCAIGACDVAETTEGPR